MSNDLKEEKESIKVVKTDKDSKDGQNKCNKCGSTDIELNVETGKLRCNFCHNEFEPIKVEGLEKDIEKIKGKIIGSGASEIKKDITGIITLKCESCGAEVVIDTNTSTQARCHWCRNILSQNNQIENGTIPDVVLPFHLTKKEARDLIESFVKKRKFFANPKFKQEFTTENIIGVYFPYMIIDINSHVKLVGQGEHLVRTYWRGSKEDRRQYYDADLYNVSREFDLEIRGLTIESNSDRINNRKHDKTNNIINSIMPFDTENCVKFDSNYLRGYNSEKRDIDVTDLEKIVSIQGLDIARYRANETLKKYDRGVCWSDEKFNLIGSQWQAAYLPVWLYSYQEKKGKKQVLHYVAVNARTKETMGSIPIHMPKLILISSIIEFFSIYCMTYVDSEYGVILLTPGIIFFVIMYGKYRNGSARHTYEKETESDMNDLVSEDTYVRQRTGLSNSRMIGANNTVVRGSQNKANIIESVIQKGGKL